MSNRPKSQIRIADAVAPFFSSRAAPHELSSLIKSFNGRTDTSYKIPGGGFISTVEDLAKFAIAMQGATLVKKDTLNKIGSR